MNVQNSYPQRWWALGVLCLCLFMSAMDNLIVNVALPTLAIALSTSASQLQWIVEAYSLVFAGLLLLGGSLGDRFGGRNVLTVGLAIFGVASVVGATASAATTVIASRAIMGVGAALIMPSTLSLIKHMFPDNERSRAIGIWAGTASVGVAAGPLVGGWLLEHFWWGSIFLVNVPLVLIGLVAARRLLPVVPTREVPLDFVGAALSFAGIASLVYGIIEAAHWGWTSPITLGIILIAIVLLALFVRWERCVAHPMLQITLFRNRTFSTAIGANLLTYIALAGFSFILPQYLQSVQGYSPLQAGLRTLPVAAAVAVASVTAATVTRRIGTKATVAGGLALVALGLGLMSLLTTTTSYTLLIAAMFLLGVGAGGAYAAGTDAVIGVVPTENVGAASAANEMSLELGTVFGIAILGSVLSSGYSRAMLASTLPDTIREAAAESIGTAVHLASESSSAIANTLLEYARNAFMGATHSTALVGVGLVLCGVLLTLLYLPSRVASSGSASANQPPTH